MRARKRKPSRNNPQLAKGLKFKESFSTLDWGYAKTLFNAELRALWQKDDEAAKKLFVERLVDNIEFALDLASSERSPEVPILRDVKVLHELVFENLYEKDLLLRKQDNYRIGFLNCPSLAEIPKLHSELAAKTKSLFNEARLKKEQTRELSCSAAAQYICTVKRFQTFSDGNGRVSAISGLGMLKKQITEIEMRSIHEAAYVEALDNGMRGAFRNEFAFARQLTDRIIEMTGLTEHVEAERARIYEKVSKAEGSYLLKTRGQDSIETETRLAMANPGIKDINGVPRRKIEEIFNLPATLRDWHISDEIVHAIDKVSWVSQKPSSVEQHLEEEKKQDTGPDYEPG